MPIVNGKMVNWKYKIQIKDLLSRNDDPENARQVGKKIYKRLAKLNFMQNFMYLDEFEYLDEDVPLDHLNDLLDNLYDYCDMWLIWVD